MSVCIKVLAFLLSAVLITEAAFVVNSSDCQNSQGQFVCITSDCVTTAASIMSKMDPTVDPCEDFYQFACGSWLEETVIPKDRKEFDTITMTQENIDITLIDLLGQKSSDDEKDLIKKAKAFYASCVDLETINAYGANPLVDLIQSTFQGWPLANESWDESQFDFQEGVKNIFSLDIQAFFNVFVSKDIKTTTQRVLYIDQPSFLLPRRKSDYNLEAYENRIVATAQLMLGDNDNMTVDRDQAREIINFEIELAKISITSMVRLFDDPSTYNLTNLADLQIDYGEIVDWSSFINDMFGMDGVNDSITDNEVIINKVPSFFNKLADLLNKTSDRVKANYLIWRVVAHMSYYLSEDFLEIIQDYKSVVRLSHEPKPRSSRCKERTTDYLRPAVGRLFMESNFNNESKVEVMEMIDNIQDAFNGIVDDAQWMDANTKQVVKEKNQHMGRSVGCSDEVANDTAMSILYENYTFDADDFFGNMVGALQESFKENLRSLRLPVGTKHTRFRATAVRAFYHFPTNHILFPAGILQPPRFSIKYPRSLNYGGIGTLIGHEITHAFDDRGRRHDKEGNIVQWWNESAVTNFEARAMCMAQQYGSFFYEKINMTVDGNLTLNENIADNAGLKESFKAYRSWVAAQGNEEDNLPGLDLTNNQLFFLAFAQSWCAKERQWYTYYRIKFDKHSPERFRVIGSLQNSEDFNEAYQCKPGSYMNPEKKCSVW